MALLLVTRSFVMRRTLWAFGAALAVMTAIALISGPGTTSGWAAWVAAFSTVLGSGALMYLGWPIWVARIHAPHALALDLARRSPERPIPEHGDIAARVAEFGSADVAQIMGHARRAHLDATGLVQGLAGHLPDPVSRLGWLSRWTLRLMARPMADAATAQALATSATPADLSQAAVTQVALSAEHLPILVARTSRTALLAGIALLGVAIFVGALVAAFVAPFLPGYALAVVGAVALAFWFGPASAVLLALSIVERANKGEGPAAEPWLARLSASSPAFRALALGPASQEAPGA